MNHENPQMNKRPGYMKAGRVYGWAADKTLNTQHT